MAGKQRTAMTPEPEAPDLEARCVELMIEALQFASKTKAEEALRHWLGRGGIDPDDPGADFLLTYAMVLAADLATFTPSASGATAIDRLRRQRKPTDRAEIAAFDALQQARFRILRIEAMAGDGLWRCADLASGGTLTLGDDGFPEDCVGIVFTARTAPAGDGTYFAAGPTAPLDDEALAVAQGFFRPQGRGLSNPERCAEAVYRQLVRHGGPQIPGMNLPMEDDDMPFDPDQSNIEILAAAWAVMAPDGELSAEAVQKLRNETCIESLMAALDAVSVARSHDRDDLATGYTRLAALQVETIHRRAAIGLGGGRMSLDVAAAAIAAAVAAEEIRPEAQKLFETLRSRLRVSSADGARPPGAADLDRLIQRIQGLRAKTVDQGCTEEEALAAARKVGELLDRYGLSLSEIDLRHQACEGAGIETERRRLGPIDYCVPVVAEFFDCRVWAERNADDTIRYIFFGLRGDVVAAQYLYDLIDITFRTESDRFRAGDFYRDLPSGQRRSGTTSFQTGLADGIAGKLRDLRRQREETVRSESGRDLVPIKTSVVEDELATLGLSFHKQKSTSKRLVISDAYAAGHEIGREFEVVQGLEEGDS